MSQAALAQMAADFHFQFPHWLWALTLPVLFLPRYWRKPGQPGAGGLAAYADTQLLPHLIITGAVARPGGRAWPLFWLGIWTLGVLALAGPRWDYDEVPVFQSRGGVFVMLDLSSSMDAADVKPSRLERARQELADLLRAAEHLRFGVLAFAAVPHLVAPVTDDKNTLLNLLPALDTALITIQGSNLGSALERVLQLTKEEPEAAWDLLLISDGDLENLPGGEFWEQLGQRNIRLHTMGIGTPDGAPVPDAKGNWRRDSQGRVILSRLRRDTLQELARQGGGRYLEASFLDQDSKTLLEEWQKHRAGERQERTIRLWEDRFYVLVMPLALLLLPLFRRATASPPQLVATANAKAPG